MLHICAASFQKTALPIPHHLPKPCAINVVFGPNTTLLAHPNNFDYPHLFKPSEMRKDET